VALGSIFGPLGGLVGGIAGSIYGFVRSHPYSGAVTAIMHLEKDRQTRLIEEISGILLVAGAAIESLEMAGGLTTALHQFASQDGVRDNIWNACVTSLS